MAGFRAQGQLILGVLVAQAFAALTGCGGSGGSMASGAAGSTGAAGTASQAGSTGSAGNPDAGGAAGQDAGDDTSSTQTPTTWGEATRGPDVGPFLDVKFFRAGCGQQIWGRWINGSDFTLGETTVHKPSGDTVTTTYLDGITFTAGKKSIFLLNDGGSFGPGSYKVDLQISSADGTHTHSISAQADDSVYQWPGRIALDGISARPSGDARLTIKPTFDGSLVRVFLYDQDAGANQGCVVSQTVFQTTVDFQNGISTEFDLSTAHAASGRHLLALLQGDEPATHWTFYSTFDLVTP